MSKAGGVYAVLVRQWSCDGERLESENWIGGAHDGTKHFSPSELYIDFFFVIFLLLNTFLLATAGTRIG